MKKLILFALLLSIGLFGSGCITPPTNQTNGTNVTVEPAAKVVLFYDPASGQLIDQLMVRTQVHLPSAPLEKRCVDFGRIIYDQPGASENTCILTDGQDKYNTNVNMLKGLLQSGAQSPLFVLEGSNMKEVSISINPLVLANNICKGYSFTECSALPQPQPVKATLYAKNESDVLIFSQLVAAFGQNGITIQETDKMATAEDKAMLKQNTKSNFLPVLMTSETDADNAFVLDLFVEQLAGGQASLKAEKVGNAYVFYPAAMPLEYYIGSAIPIKATAYVPAGKEADFTGVFDAYAAENVLLDVTYVGANASVSKALVNESGQTYLPIAVINSADLTAEQKASLDALVNQPIQGSQISYYMKKVGDKYYGYTSLSSSDLFIGPKLQSVTLDLYIMSQCPYGLQMQKAMIPVVELFSGTGKLTVNNKFVYYTMHGEPEVVDNLIEYCVGQKAPAKQWPFIRCYAESNGDSNTCMASLGISKPEIDTCVASSRTSFGISGTKFPIHAAENTQYGVEGSPTLVFQGKKLQLNRDPEAIKQFVCSMLEAPLPVACSTTLAYNIQPGFGPVNGTGSASGGAASCGT